MAFLTNVSASGNFLRRAIPEVGAHTSGARLDRFATPAVREACTIVSALVIVAAMLAGAALLDIWMWVPRAIQ